MEPAAVGVARRREENFIVGACMYKVGSYAMIEWGGEGRNQIEVEGGNDEIIGGSFPQCAKHFESPRTV